MFRRNTNNNINSRMISQATANLAYINLFKVLATFTKTLNPMFYQYSLGNFSEVATLLTQTEYNKLAMKLHKLKQNARLYPEYEFLRTEITTALAGLYQSIMQYGKLINTEHDLAACEAQEAILYDMKKLQAFLDKRKQTTYLFKDTNVTITKAEIKPVYAKYIELYGFPPGAIFEMDKLANATNLLNT